MQTDADFLGLSAVDDEGRARFTVIDRLSRLDNRLYGGAAIAISVAAAEAATDRPALWITTQFVSTVELGAEVDVLTEILAEGRRTDQVRVTATDGAGDVIFASLGATGHHRPDGLAGEFERIPSVSSPEDSERWDTPIVGVAKAAGLDPDDFPPLDAGFSVAMDIAEPTVFDHPEPGPGRICLWLRRRDRVAITRALAAYLADIVPMGVAHALGVLAAGTSLDNTIRFGAWVETEWLLVDLRPSFAAGGYAHGAAHLWSQDGRLLATASQTASMKQFDPGNLPASAASR